LAGRGLLGEGALAIAAGTEPEAFDLEPEVERPLVDDGTCTPKWAPFLGRFRLHNPWLPTFVIAAREKGLVIGTDWVDGSERFPLTPMESDVFRVGY
jgi:hypothetical protein